MDPSPSFPQISPQFAGVDGSYARYPIHVERAIYRLSHIKLANPRRPLYEQVLISNLMFWYLGVINKTQSPSSPSPGQQQGSSPTTDKETKEREQKEAEERQKAEKEKERLEDEKEREREQQKKETAPRRAGLTKTPSAGAPAGRRAAETPVKGPQYEMQHRVMEQEYGGYGSGSTAPLPARSNAAGGGQSRPSQNQNADIYYTTGGNQQRTPHQLPRLCAGHPPLPTRCRGFLRHLLHLRLKVVVLPPHRHHLQLLEIRQHILGGPDHRRLTIKIDLRLRP